MQSIRRIIATVVMVVFCTHFASMVMAEDKILVKGKISGYDLEKRTLMVTIDGGEKMTFAVQDDKALGMLDDQLYAGDDVKIRYLNKNGKNVIDNARDLKSARPGC